MEEPPTADRRNRVTNISFPDGSSQDASNINLIYAQSEWPDPITRNERISLTFLPPSGVAEKSNEGLQSADDVDVRIECGNILSVIITWPWTMQNVEKLVGLWLQGEEGKTKLEMYHPMIQRFIRFLEQTKSKSTDKTKSTMRLQLPRDVKPDFQEEILQWDGTGQRVLFLTCFAPDRDFHRPRKTLNYGNLGWTEIIPAQTKQDLLFR